MKCCNNCRRKDDCNIYIYLQNSAWGKSKDYCSKWEEKEKTLIEELMSIWETGQSPLHGAMSYKHLFRQKIKESLDNALLLQEEFKKEREKEAKEGHFASVIYPKISDFYERAFNWILEE